MNAEPVSALQYGYPLQCRLCGNDGPRFTRLYQLEAHLATVHLAAAPEGVGPSAPGQPAPELADLIKQYEAAWVALWGDIQTDNEREKWIASRISDAAQATRALIGSLTRALIAAPAASAAPVEEASPGDQK